MAQHGRHWQRQQRERGARVFEKPARTADELVDQLDQRGLVIPDRDRAKRYVRQLGYFRLSPYTIPFQELPRTNEHLFKPEVEFDHVLDLYVFDRQLRLLVMDALGRIEVAVRAAISDHMAITHEDPHWNVGLGVYPKIPTSRDISWLQGGDALPRSSEKRLYPVLVSLQVVLNVISPRSSWASRLHALLSSRPAMNLRGMGIPEDWARDPFWAAHV